MKKNICIMLASLSLMACAPGANQKENAEFDYTVERFADLEVLRYQVKGFDELPLEQKKLIYFLQESALYGRDILFDQTASGACLFATLLRLSILNIRVIKQLPIGLLLRHTSSKSGLPMACTTTTQATKSFLLSRKSSLPRL